MYEERKNFNDFSNNNYEVKKSLFTPKNKKLFSETKSSYFTMTVTSSDGNQLSNDEYKYLKSEYLNEDKLKIKLLPVQENSNELILKVTDSEIKCSPHNENVAESTISKTSKDEKLNNLKDNLLENLITNSNLVELTIVGYEIKNIIFQHVNYLIEVKSANLAYKIFRRYSEFLKLRELLKNKYVGVFIPSLPLKEIFRNREIALIEFRKKFLQIFLHELQITYFYLGSVEIQSFLDPNISTFPPDNLLIINSMSRQCEIIMLDEVLQCTLQKVKNNYTKHQYSFILSHYININNHLPNLNPINDNYKELHPQKILDNVKSCNKFSKLLIHKKKFLEKILIVIKNMPNEYREINDSKILFIETIRKFQKDFIFALADSSQSKSEDNILELSRGIESSDLALKKIEDNLKEGKSFHKLLKNLHDWIYKEIINLDSCIECIHSLIPFIEKVKKVDEELNKLERSASLSESYINYEVKSNLETKLQKLKEIIALNSMFINEVELTKYKTCRFLYYYNCLKYTFLQNEIYYKDQTMYLDCLQNVIVLMKIFLDQIKNNSLTDI